MEKGKQIISMHKGTNPNPFLMNLGVWIYILPTKHKKEV